MPIIKVENVTKQYQLGQLASIRDSFNKALARVQGQSVQRRKAFHALEDISFSVERGEVVGIIGTNGAGKSTLLKLISGITKPTSGSIKVNGAIAPLIEVGAGLHPELTGRENVFLNASILGIRRDVIKRRLDEIVSFAELEEFIDTPVKRYSSGMKIRLGFAIATSLDADVLIVDEVLAVGDLAFQRKCLDRMEDLIRRSGNTVLLVSHNLRQVVRMCNRVIMLEQGHIQLDGNPDQTCNAFYEYSNQKILMQHKNKKYKSQAENKIFRLEAIDILDRDGNCVDGIVHDEGLSVRIVFTLKIRIERPEFVIGTHTTDFVYLTANSTDALPSWPDFEAGRHEIRCVWPLFPLKTGVYCIRIAFFDKFRGLIFSDEGLAPFSVTSKDESSSAPLRLLDLPATWTTVKV